MCIKVKIEQQKIESDLRSAVSNTQADSFRSIRERKNADEAQKELLVNSQLQLELAAQVYIF